MNMLFCKHSKTQNQNFENAKYCVIAMRGFVTFCHAHLEQDVTLFKTGTLTIEYGQ